jgi:hypothetical protein
MPSDDRDVWVAIVSDKTRARELQYLTYAIYSFERYEWYEQMEKERGKVPTPHEINDWIAQITKTRIQVWGDSAARTFDSAARAYLEDEFAKKRQEILDNSVVSRIKESLETFGEDLRNAVATVQKSSSFGNVLFTSFIAAILAPIILGLIILAIQAADLWPTSGAIEKLFHHETTDEHPSAPAHKS